MLRMRASAFHKLISLLVYLWALTCMDVDVQYDPPQVTEDFIRGDHTQEEWEEDDDLGDDDLGEW